MSRLGMLLFACFALAACDGEDAPADASADGGAPRSDAAAVDASAPRCVDPGCRVAGARGVSPRVRAPGVPPERATLTVRLDGDGAGRVRSDPPGLDCALPCEASFPVGTTVTMTLEPVYRSTVEGFAPAALGCDGGTCTVTIDGPRTVTARLDHHAPLRLSESDRDPMVRLREDGLAADFYIHGGVRSVQTVAPGSGVFYLEGRALIDDRVDLGFGVATALAPLLETYAGATDQSFGVLADGSLAYDGEWLGDARASSVYGLVIDYRGRSPVVHVIAPDGSGGAQVAHSEVLGAIETSLHVFAAGSKRAPEFQLEINAGNDTENLPFAFDARAALRSAGLADVANGLVLGFGDTYAGPPDAAPALRTSADQVVTPGTPVTVSATAYDREEGDLGASIEWDLLSSPHYAGRLRAVGPTFSFTPTAVGVHPARARVRDRTGRVVERVVRVRVSGPVAQRDPVRLEPDARSGAGITIAADGLAARWTLGGKHGVRANQSLYGEWGYFEITRLTEPVNEGGGLVVGDGNLDPYTWTDVPASCSVNMLGGVWEDLIWRRNFPGPPEDFATYGFAVDYRGEHPIVYVITGGELVAELVLGDVWVELYPMIYGDWSGVTEPGEYDEAIEFGANGFVYDPVAILSAEGVDTAELVPGWGHANTRPE